MKRLINSLKFRYNKYLKNILFRIDIPIGIDNLILNFIFRRLLRVNYEKGYDLRFFDYFYTNKHAAGPLQRDEAILLYGILKVIRPKTLVEFGFNNGNSTYSLLKAIDKDCLLFSYDISNKSKWIAERYFSKRFKNFKFLHKGQDDFDPADCEFRKIDYVFFDASHDFQINSKTFLRLYENLSANAIVMIHDTGLWNADLLLKMHHDLLPLLKYKEVQGRIAHQYDERLFVNWVCENFPEFEVIHFHSENVLRHGLTLLSRTPKNLAV
jgi:predicted O-methyltransferase YrrM